MYRPERGEFVLVRIEDKFGLDHVTSGHYRGEGDGEHFEIDLVDSPYVERDSIRAHKEDLYEATEENKEEYLD
jgi:hypothetical protein